MSRSPSPRAERALWRAALGAFVLAAATGAAMRFGAIHGLPFGLSYANVRHAHSHLMFFSWVTPAAMAFASARLWPARARRGGRRVAFLALATGLIAYPPFLASGYGRLEIAGRDLPASMMAAGLAGVSWYLFALLHVRATRGRERTLPLLALDGGVALLVLASIAATALAGVGMAGLASTAWMPALITLFLESFGDGWFSLALLSLAFEARGRSVDAPSARTGTMLLAGGLVARGLARLALDVGAGGAAALAAVAAFAAGLGLLLALGPLLRAEVRRAPSAWTVPLALLAAKGAAELLLAWPPARAWSDAMGLHVVLLHAFLLGAVSLGLVAAARDGLGPRAAGAPALLAPAVLAMLAALLPLTGAWPAAWRGAWALEAAAWTSLGPPAVVAGSLLAVLLRRRRDEGD